MTKVEPKYRRPLNEDQHALLRVLFIYRFCSSKQLAEYEDKASVKHIQKRLKILEDQGYIAKRYDKSYKLLGRPAEYYLAPKGGKLLQTIHTKDRIPDQAIKNRYKDKTASRKFMDHSIAIASTWLKLKELYPNQLDVFLTASHLSLKQYDYFPRWKPHAYFVLRNGAKGTGQKHEYFLDVFDGHIPFFVRVRRIKSYLTYADSGDWEGTLPTILMICENQSTQKRLRRRIVKELNNIWDEETTFYITTQPELMSSSSGDKIWELATDADSKTELK
jgi:DNA-binding HxlR family transcriptional regulator